MALTFGAATSDRVNAPTAYGFVGTTAITLLIVARRTQDTQNRRLTVVQAGSTEIFQYQTTSGAPTQLTQSVARATTPHTLATSTTFSQNIWYIYAFTYNENGGAGNVGHIYYAPINGQLIEASYTTNTDGVGATSSGSVDNIYIGNRSVANTAWQGDIALLRMWPRTLSYAELDVEIDRFYRIPPGCMLAYNLGQNGTSMQFDLASVHNGTVTGTTWSPTPDTLFRRPRKARIVHKPSTAVYATQLFRSQFYPPFVGNPSVLGNP